MEKENFKLDPTQLVGLVNKLRKYHKHEVHGLENVPTSGSGLFVVNHSLATYDISLLSAAVYEDQGRIPRWLVDRLFYKIPYLRDLMNGLGAEAGSQENAEKLVREGNLVFVAPGGMREALRPSSERYQIRWGRRKGFIKLAIRTQTPIILAACPKADDIYDVYPSRLTSFFYQNFKIPLFLARGLGPSPLPRPVKLDHFVAKPIQPPKYDESVDQEKFDKMVDALHKKVVQKMQQLIFKGIQHRDK